VQKILGALNWTRHKLRIKHYVESIDPEISLGLLVSAVHLNHITQTLKRVEREPDGKNNLQHRHWVAQIQEAGEGCEIGIEKIEILKGKQERAQRDYAQGEKKLPSFLIRALDIDPCEIINYDRSKKN
jgi:hypothetical protein